MDILISMFDWQCIYFLKFWFWPAFVRVHHINFAFNWQIWFCGHLNISKYEPRGWQEASDRYELCLASTYFLSLDLSLQTCALERHTVCSNKNWCTQTSLMISKMISKNLIIEHEAKWNVCYRLTCSVFKFNCVEWMFKLYLLFK